MSLHKMAELHHTLREAAFRVAAEEATMLTDEIIRSPAIVEGPVTPTHCREAVSESSRTIIHFWTNLCFIPVKGIIRIMYTTDPYFERICREHNVRLVNPTSH